MGLPRQRTTSEAIKRKLQADAWANIMTGIGTRRDKIQHSDVYWTPTSRARAENLFAGDDLGGKVATIIPLDGTREGITWEMEDKDSTIIPWLDDEFKRLHTLNKLYWAWTLGRAFGGALAILSIDDGKEMDQPVNVNTIKSINAINVVDRWQVQIYTQDMIVDPSSPFFGQPQWYTYVGDYQISENEKKNLINMRIHRSRVLRFDGYHLTERMWKANNYWHDSIYGRLWEPLRNYTMVHNSIASMLQEFNQPVFKLQGLAAALQGDQDELVIKKLNQVNISRSVARAIAIDSADTFENVSAPVSGINDLVNQTIARLTAASNIPHTRLMGEGPSGGLGADGQSELSDYYDFVGAQQEVNLRDPIKYLTELLFMQKSATVKAPAKWNFTFNPLETPSLKEQKETELVQANIDEVYMRTGVVDSFEIAQSRYGSGKYSYQTNLDKENRREAEQAEEDDENGGMTEEDLA